MRLDSSRIVRGLLLLNLLFMGHQHGYAGQLWPEQEQRLSIGLKLFPAVLGAMEDLSDKTVSRDQLLILVAHDAAPGVADQAIKRLNDLGKIRGFSLRVTGVPAARVNGFKQDPIGGIFVASPGISPSLLRSWSEKFRTLVFSPFTGDVEHGAVAGVYVADSILPFINRTQAKRAGVRFRPFFMGVARTHD